MSRRTALGALFLLIVAVLLALALAGTGAVRQRQGAGRLLPESTLAYADLPSLTRLETSWAPLAIWREAEAGRRAVENLRDAVIRTAAELAGGAPALDVRAVLEEASRVVLAVERLEEERTATALLLQVRDPSALVRRLKRDWELPLQRHPVEVDGEALPIWRAGGAEGEPAVWVGAAANWLILSDRQTPVRWSLLVHRGVYPPLARQENTLPRREAGGSPAVHLWARREFASGGGDRPGAARRLVRSLPDLRAVGLSLQPEGRRGIVAELAVPWNEAAAAPLAGLERLLPAQSEWALGGRLPEGLAALLGPAPLPGLPPGLEDRRPLGWSRLTVKGALSFVVAVPYGPSARVQEGETPAAARRRAAMELFSPRDGTVKGDEAAASESTVASVEHDGTEYFTALQGEDAGAAGGLSAPWAVCAGEEGLLVAPSRRVMERALTLLATHDGKGARGEPGGLPPGEAGPAGSAAWVYWAQAPVGGVRLEALPERHWVEALTSSRGPTLWRFAAGEGVLRGRTSWSGDGTSGSAAARALPRSAAEEETGLSVWSVLLGIVLLPVALVLLFVLALVLLASYYWLEAWLTGTLYAKTVPEPQPLSPEMAEELGVVAAESRAGATETKATVSGPAGEEEKEAQEQDADDGEGRDDT